LEDLKQIKANFYIYRDYFSEEFDKIFEKLLTKKQPSLMVLGKMDAVLKYLEH
jgi:hypothetical protein